MWRLRFGSKKKKFEIQPDEIFIDSENLPEFDTDQFEGRIEQPISQRSFIILGLLVLAVLITFVARAGELQIVNGEIYAIQARENQLAEHIIFADRGLVVDRKGNVLVGNERISVLDDFAERTYSQIQGLSHVLGYVKPPAKDSSGFYFRESFTGIDGVERAYDTLLAGKNGVDLTETNAKGEIVSKVIVRPPVSGATLTLSLDSEVTQALHNAIAKRAKESKFQGGSGVIIDVQNGEILALTNFPEYSPKYLTQGSLNALSEYQKDTRQPFLNRATSGLYAPGSIVKPFVAAGALTEGVIDEYKQILSTGSISIPNPYDTSNPSIFRDWKAHGLVDMRHALAVSSDVYFYEIGGGFQQQKGLGIYNLDKYFRLFGFGAPTRLAGFNEPSGTIPTPEWKAANFEGDPWRVGNTYHTAIGQYGMQVTPLQAVRAIAAVANGGNLLTPTLTATIPTSWLNVVAKGRQLPLDVHTLDVVREGMRLSVTEGTAAAVNVSYVSVAGKTGTAQLGTSNQFMNSWIIGFFPYEHPRYAFAIVLEKSPAGTLIGAPAAMREFLEWMQANAQEYFK